MSTTRYLLFNLGFGQWDGDDRCGLTVLAREAHGDHFRKNVRIVVKRWNERPKAIANDAAKYRNGTMRFAGLLYSYGNANGLQVCRELKKLGVTEGIELFMIDAVPYPTWMPHAFYTTWLMARVTTVLNLLFRRPLTIPSNVDRVVFYRQHQLPPWGVDLVPEDPRTEIVPGPESDEGHVEVTHREIDNDLRVQKAAKEFIERFVTARKEGLDDTQH
ncbi:MAG: hypothetical protein AAGJ97_00420 [Planctomycetota bacterium]